MIAGILIGKLCIVAAVAAVALILEIGVPILRLKLLARQLANDEKVKGVENAGGAEEIERVERVEEVARVEKVERGEQVEDVGGVDETVGKSSPRLADDSATAQMLWKQAREMPHNFIPDPDEDCDYLSKVYMAARLGHLEAMVKLGDYAYRRGAVVEAFYWTLLAEMKGAVGLNEVLCEMRTQWLAEGCPEEYENTYVEFAEEQGVFARAVLRLQCDVDPQYACARLEELAERGVEEARLFLEKGNASDDMDL